MVCLAMFTKNCLLTIIFNFLCMKVFLLLSIKRYRCYVTKRNMICKVAVFWVYQKYLKTACNWTCQKNWQALLGASLAVKPRMSFNKNKNAKIETNVMHANSLHWKKRWIWQFLHQSHRWTIQEKKKKLFFHFPFKTF